MTGKATMKEGNYFHRTIDLQFGCGCDALRQLVNKKLDRMQTTLKDYINNNKSVKQSLCKLYPRYLTKEQYQLLYPNPNDPDPNEQNFDITLVTLLLLNGLFTLTSNEKDCVIKLRKIRNKLSHISKPELQDDTIFNEASNYILSLAKTFGKEFEKKTRQRIASLRKTELVKFVSKGEVVKLRNESFMVALIEGLDKETTDKPNATFQRYNLTKWARRFTEVVQLDNLLADLKKEGVLSLAEKTDIQKHYNKAEQCNALIMKITDETSEQVWKFCKCVRKHNPDLADLIENMADDGANIEANLESCRDSQVLQTIKILLKRNENGVTATEALHIAVEEHIGYAVPFHVIETIVDCEFKIKPTGEFGSRYYGLEMMEIPRSSTTLTGEGSTKTGEGKSVHWKDTCEELAEKLYLIMERKKEGYGVVLKETIINECLSPKNFSRLSEEKLERCLQYYLHGKRLPIGVLEDLIDIQTDIRCQLDASKNENIEQEKRMCLREFDCAPITTAYAIGEIVKPEKGNILVPVHEFRSVQGIDTTIQTYIVKESVRFLNACLNTRQNGTIHFGIRSIAEGTGKTEGIQRQYINVDELNLRIENGIESCFEGKHVDIAKICVRPVQIIRIDDAACVVELDVVPSSWYTGDIVFQIKFPPKGKQMDHVFYYTAENNPEIISTPINRLEDTKNIYADRLKDRIIAEARANETKSAKHDRFYPLKHRLTSGATYITDHYRPVIFCGKISGIESEDSVRNYLENSLEDFFKSAAVVFDFDDKSRTRKYAEGNSNIYFQVRTTNDDVCLKDNPPSKPMWIYCNGNKELSIRELNTNDWIKERKGSVQSILNDLNEILPRAILIFLIFGSCSNDNPLLNVANEIMISAFRNRCVVIAESDLPVYELKRNVLKRETDDEDFETHFYTKLPWSDVTKVLKFVTKPSNFEDIQLPCRNGKVAFLTQKSIEEMNITDIEIVSGKQCIEVEEMDIEKQRAAKIQAKESFYRGDEVSWNNFHFDGQVCMRDIFPDLVHSVREKLENGKELIEVKTILHQPGSGGTTTGRYLIWTLSQFKNNILESSYRCCIVRQIQESTAEQICSFMFHDENAPKAAVILIDNASEDSVGQLKTNLMEKAYRIHKADEKVFCLLIVVRRVVVTYEKKENDTLLVHQLKEKEQTWFEDKYKELEGTEEIDVSTLIAFNVMRKSFDSQYIDELVDHLLGEVKITEIPVLKCLSLINVFDRDSLIPMSVFDHLISGGKKDYRKINLEDCIQFGPIGLVVPFQKRQSHRTKECPWNANNTNAFKLITRLSSSNCNALGQDFIGVMMVSQPLAESVLNKLLISEDIPLQKIVEFVLDIMRKHVKRKNPMSKEFVKIVTSLFKTRSFLTEEGDTRAKFSEMIMTFLNIDRHDDTNDMNQIVIGLMMKCFEMSQDAMVGQQLARFYIYLKDYTSAEDIIKKAIKIQPGNSYLRDTFGQIFFSRMEQLLSGKDFTTENVSQIITTAFLAIEKFKDGQTITLEKESGDNTNCYLMEVKTIVFLLENFYRFSFYTDETELLGLLNNTEQEVPDRYKALYELPDFCKLIRNSPSQVHVEHSLRFLEEKDYQLKKRWYTIITDKDEKLLLKLRERFERFYGNEGELRPYKFKYGVGLKSLMNAYDKDDNGFLKTVDDVQLKLQRKGLQNVDKRDLLIHLGHKVIMMSSREEMMGRSEQLMSPHQYQMLLKYSDILLQMEERSQRPYLEAFLYYTIFNWPSDARLDVPQLGGPSKLKNVLDQWNEKYQQNFKNLFKKKSMPPKTFFALGNGPLGRDIVDFQSVEREWRRTTRKTRSYVQDDQVWEKEYARKVLKRLEGTMDGTGSCILFETKHGHWNYKLDIHCLYNSDRLSNRPVSFVLLFTWSGPKATDIRGIKDELSLEEEGPSSLESRDGPDSGEISERRPDSSNGKDRSKKRGGAKGLLD